MRASKEARTHRRWREQEARLIVLSGDPTARCTAEGPIRDVVAAGPAHFDVAHVRAYAESLIAEGERLEAERFIFAEWTRTQGREGITTPLGMGPECRDPHAFKPPAAWASGGKQCECAGWAREIGPNERDFAAGRVAFLRHAKGCTHVDVVGGWPGPLAREWGTVRCEACARGCANCGSPARGEVIAGDDGEWFCSTACHDDHDENSCPLERGFGEVQRRRRRLHGDRCKPCKGRGYVKRYGREAAAANGGAWMIRAGRRLLDTLDGRCPWAPSAAAQPSECQRCLGSAQGHPVAHGPFESGGRVEFVLRQSPCESCRGTGYNLSGMLPPVEDGTATVARAADGFSAAWTADRRPAAWQAEVMARCGHLVQFDGDGTAHVGPMHSAEPTRVVPRGQHRHPGAGYYVRPQDVLELDADERPSLDDRINGRCWTPAGRPMIGLYEPLAPRWVNGERRHAEQRRERDRRSG